MVKLYLARHGQTVENTERIFQGHLPGKLTELGIEQAEKLHDELFDTSFDIAVSSDLKRAIDTMKIVIGGKNIKYVTTPLLREIGWGSWTGLKIHNVDLSHFPDDVETEVQLYERAAEFVDYVKSQFQGMTILAVGHGLINRSIQAVIESVPLEDIRSVKRMCNAEYRIFEIE